MDVSAALDKEITSMSYIDEGPEFVRLIPSVPNNQAFKFLTVHRDPVRELSNRQRVFSSPATVLKMLFTVFHFRFRIPKRLQ